MPAVAGANQRRPDARRVRFARQALLAWSDYIARVEFGAWPASSPTAQVARVAREGLRTDGAGRYRSRIVVALDAMGRPVVVRREPPPWPAETRAQAASRAPRLPPGGLGRRVDRELRRMDQDGRDRASMVLRASVLIPGAQADIAAALQMGVRTYRRWLALGISDLTRGLTSVAGFR